MVIIVQKFSCGTGPLLEEVRPGDEAEWGNGKIASGMVARCRKRKEPVVLYALSPIDDSKLCDICQEPGKLRLDQWHIILHMMEASSLHRQ